jgi:hypothetical protein
LLAGNPPARWGAPGDDLAEPSGVRKREVDGLGGSSAGGGEVQPTVGRAIAATTTSRPSVPGLFCRRHIDLQRIAGALCCRRAG